MGALVLVLKPTTSVHQDWRVSDRCDRCSSKTVDGTLLNSNFKHLLRSFLYSYIKHPCPYCKHTVPQRLSPTGRPRGAYLSFELVVEVHEDEAGDLDQCDDEGALGHGAQVVPDQAQHRRQDGRQRESVLIPERENNNMKEH